MRGIIYTEKIISKRERKLIMIHHGISMRISMDASMKKKNAMGRCNRNRKKEKI